MGKYVEALKRDIMQTVEEAIEQVDRAERIAEGWIVPNGTLFIPAPESYQRDKQVMTVGITYYTSSALLVSALDNRVLDIVEAILGPNLELFGNGQSLAKEPVGGHSKHLHQDSAYFEHKYEGPVAVLCYAVNTDHLNGALHVAPGSHKLGQLEHVDTASHLGLAEEDWSWEESVPVPGQAGDAIFFHVRTIHGSKPNYSDSPRPVFIHRYCQPGDFVTVSATTTAKRAEAEKRSAEATKSNSQRGLMVRGLRKATVD
jgi:phytanoyl-CoA hydroxylase